MVARPRLPPGRQRPRPRRNRHGVFDPGGVIAKAQMASFFVRDMDSAPNGPASL